MSMREGYPKSRPPASIYCLSLSRGDVAHSVRLGRAGVGALAALALISCAWTASVTVYVAFHDDLIGAILEQRAEMKAAYEDRLAEASAKLDAAASRQMLERNAFNGKVSEVTSRQARLEQRGAIVAALAESEMRTLSTRRQIAKSLVAPDAVSAIRALAPPTAAGAGVDDDVRAYAPLPRPGGEPRAVKPHPIDERGETLSALPSDAWFTTASVTASADTLDPSARLALLDPSLDRIESNQAKALAAIDRAAERSASRDAAIVAETGLDPAKLVLPHGEGGVGGPYISADNLAANAPPLDPALTRVAHDVATAERLKALMSFVPLRIPLSGDPSITSPFGYRADPFLGRLALHPGVDLAEAYGAEIHAAAAGRVVRAVPAGGYGNMVEIDHGNGLATRYAHMSEILVEEGQQVSLGAIVGKLGSTGRSTGPHLHYEVRVDGEPVDPERYLRAGADLAAAE